MAEETTESSVSGLSELLFDCELDANCGKRSVENSGSPKKAVEVSPSANSAASDGELCCGSPTGKLKPPIRLGSDEDGQKSD
jgi:hypothetical protein